MTNFNVAMSIWWKAILFNAVFIGACAVLQEGASGLVVILLGIIFGYIVALPLLPLIVLLVRLMRSIPYGSRDSFCWLNVMLVMLVWIFYGIVTLVLGSWPHEETFFYHVSSVTSLAVLTSIYFTKKSILNLSATSSAEVLAQNKSLSYV